MALQWMTIKLIFRFIAFFLNVKLLALAALHTDGRGDGGEYGDDEIDDLLDGFFLHKLNLYFN